MVGGATYNSDSDNDNEIEIENDSNYDTDNHEEFLKISKTLTKNIDFQDGGSYDSDSDPGSEYDETEHGSSSSSSGINVMGLYNTTSEAHVPSSSRRF